MLVDATVGFGGHTDVLLSYYLSQFQTIDLDSQHTDRHGGSLCEAHVIDADHYMLLVSKKKLEAYGGVVHCHNMFFDDYFNLAPPDTADIILMDLGVSMFHFKGANRGFSHHDTGRLDMRLSEQQEYSAYELVNEATEEALIHILYSYGEERQAAKWVHRIAVARTNEPIQTPQQLCEVLQLGKKPQDKSTIARIFQALRIEVNNELMRLSHGLAYAWRHLQKGGRLAVISFHSLEDRIVKQFFLHVSGKLKKPDNIPIINYELCNTGIVHTKKPIVASEEEVVKNKASRSAKLRVAEKNNMKQSVVLVIICVMLLISKYVVSGSYYDYSLQKKELLKRQYDLIDDNRRSISELENYRSTNYLFSQKETFQLKELNPQNTILFYPSDSFVASEQISQPAQESSNRQ